MSQEQPRHDPFDPGTTRARIEDYRSFQSGHGDGEDPLRDPSGPGAEIAVIDAERALRLVVRGRLIIQSRQLDRIAAWLGDRGIGIVSEEQDSWGLGVSLLALSGSEPTALYAAILAESQAPDPGVEPLAMSMDDVSYENVVLKPVRPQGAGRASGIPGGAERPKDTGLGAGITVGVIDGGFAEDKPARTDGWLDNVTTVTDGYPSLTQRTTKTLDAGAGHGTFVTGVVVQHAPEVTVRQYRAVDSQGFGSSWRLMNCLLAAVADGCRLINCSLGFEDPDLIGNPAISAALHRIQQASDVLVVAAAGNSGTTTPMLPASHKGAVAVGGLAADLTPVAWSNRGPWVDASTIADPVLSIYVVDPADPNPDPNPWGQWYGTSFAAPKVTGELAVLLGEGARPEEAVERVFARATLPPSPDFGYLLDLP